MKASGTAIHACDVSDYGMNNLNKPGYGAIFIGKSDDWNINTTKAGRWVVRSYVSDWNDDFLSIKAPNWF